MEATIPSSAEELFEIVLELRADLKCAQHSAAGVTYFQVEDPLTSRYYRVGLREWQVVSRLDGKRPLSEVIAAAQAAPLDNPLTPQEVVTLARWLIQSQLVQVASAARHPLYQKPAAPAKLSFWLNPVSVRLPLFNPDRLLDRSLPFCRWLLTPVAFVVWLVVLLVAGYRLWVEWERFLEPLRSILAPDNWLYLFVVWAGLKVIHEFFHGLVCKKYGGRVPSCGLMLIMFSPVAYVDVTSSWRFRSKWHRIFTAAAGMYAELFVAGIAVYVWSTTESEVVSQVCHNIVTMASVATLLFNGNFLMRFDGYYIVSDLLEIQNLYGNGQQYVRYLSRRYLLGVPATPVSGTPWHQRLIRVYGLASLMWRISFYVGVVLTSATLFHGAGIVISLLMGSLWILLPTLRFVQYLLAGQGTEQPNRRQFAIVAGGTTLLLILVLCLPWPGGVVATGVVEFEPLETIRAGSPGFLRTLKVSAGDRVEPGQPLLTIENPELQLELKRVALDLEISQVRARLYEGEEETRKGQDEAAKRDHLLERQRELKHQVAQLQVHAPIAGCLIGRQLETLLGQYLEVGESIAAIGREDDKVIVVAVPQKYAVFFNDQVELGCQPHVRVRGRVTPIRGARLMSVTPRATKQLSHASLAAPNGGPCAVAVTPGNSSNEVQPNYELLEPHFQAIVALPPEAARQLRAGELARVRLQAIGESVGEHLWNRFEDWVNRRLAS